MYHKIKNTLAGLAVATAIIGMSYSVGRPPMYAQATPPSGIDAAASYVVPGLEAGIDQVQVARKRNRGMKSQLNMPFFSFAPLLPRRES
jgi:hypothetical protein